jgi:hypothetical protein
VKLTYGDVRKLVPTLGNRFAYATWVALGVRPKDDEETSPQRAVAMGLFEWLAHLGFLTDDQAGRLVREVYPALVALATGGPFSVVVADHKYARWTGGPDGWTTIEFGDLVHNLAVDPVTLFTCNVVALAKRQRYWLTKVKEGGGEHEHHAGADRAGGEPGGQPRGPGAGDADGRRDLRDHPVRLGARDVRTAVRREGPGDAVDQLGPDDDPDGGRGAVRGEAPAG